MLLKWIIIGILWLWLSYVLYETGEPLQTTEVISEQIRTEVIVWIFYYRLLS